MVIFADEAARTDFLALVSGEREPTSAPSPSLTASFPRFPPVPRPRERAAHRRAVDGGVEVVARLAGRLDHVAVADDGGRDRSGDAVAVDLQTGEVGAVLAGQP